MSGVFSYKAKKRRAFLVLDEKREVWYDKTMETEFSKVVGTFKYGKLLSKPALAVQWAIVALSVVFSALLGSALAVARGDMATVVGWIVWGLWLLAVLGIFAELISDLFNRRLIARCLKTGDLRQGEAIGFSHPSPFFGAKAAIKTAFPDGVKTFRTRDRVLLREMEAGRAAPFYSAALDVALVAIR